MARARKKPTSSVKINFKGVESRQTPPEGDYPLTVLEATMGESGSGNDQIEFVLEISRGEYKGSKQWFYCSLGESSLWKLHAFLTALGEEVPEEEMDVDLSDLIGREIVGVLIHETYKGKKRAKMSDFDTIDNYSGDNEDDEDEKPKAKKGKKEAEPEDDEDDEDEKPKAKKGKAKPAKKKAKKLVAKSDVEEMDEDELQELLEEHGLEDEVDLDDHKKLSKKIKAVLEALEEADLLDDDDD